MSLREQIHLERDGIRMGSLHCPASHPRFHDLGPTSSFVIAFPRAPIRLEQVGGPAYLGLPGTVTLMNRGQRLLRTAADPIGDRCDWIGLDPEVALEVARDIDPEGIGNPERPFGVPFGLVPPRLYLAMHGLFRRARSDAGMAPEDATERALHLVGESLRAARQLHRGHAAPEPPTGHRRELAEAARARLAGELGSTMNLRSLADRLGTSPFHLCRVFRLETGRTLFAYRRELRLLASLDRLEDADCDLNSLALELGFSSHSHFSATFRRLLGTTPSGIRGRPRRSTATSR